MEAEEPSFESLQHGVKAIVTNARQTVEEEFHSGAGNPWHACFVSILTSVEGKFDIAKYLGYLSQEQKNQAEARLKAIEAKLQTVTQEYPGLDTVPPPAVQDDLYRALEAFSDLFA